MLVGYPRYGWICFFPYLRANCIIQLSEIAGFFRICLNCRSVEYKVARDAHQARDFMVLLSGQVLCANDAPSLSLDPLKVGIRKSNTM